MSKIPKLSYIVLSYNYERFIGVTLRSILDQTVQDFEIVVVDDASSDQSVNIVRSFADPRIKLHVNERNLGGAASYNRAVEAASGEWLVNLDADDWVAPQKAELQLAALASNPSIDIIGTYVNFVDKQGAPHPKAQEMEAHTNVAYDLNRLDTWIGANPLCRSSTMVRRAAHLRIGLDDPAMIRAPDYELWTRALRLGCRFAVLPDTLTYSRQHSQGVTHADPLGTMLEITHSMLRNLVPLAEARALYPSIERILTWVARHPQLSSLQPNEVYRLLGLMMSGTGFSDFTTFRKVLAARDEDPSLARVGRRALALTAGSEQAAHLSRLERDIGAYIKARDHWHQKSKKWEGKYRELVKAAPHKKSRSPQPKHIALLEKLANRTPNYLRWGLGRLWIKVYSRFTRSS
jgi:GT2 family glycosyltransferase